MTEANPPPLDVAPPRLAVPSRQSPSSRTRLANISLVAVLAAVIVGELLVERIATRLVHDDLLLPRGMLREALDGVAFYVFHVASVLGVLLVTLAFIKLLVEPTVVVPPRGPIGSASKLVLAVTMLLFVVVATLGVSVLLHGRLQLYLLAVFAYLVVVIVAGSLRRIEMPGRVKLWLGVLGVAAVVITASKFAAELQPIERPQLSQQLLLLGEALVVTLAAMSPLTLWPLEVPLARPLVAGLIGAAALPALAAWKRDVAMRVVGYGFGLQLPSSRLGVALFALSAGAAAAGVIGLLAKPGPARLRGYGLLLLVANGYQLELPYQLTAALVGLLCIVDSYARLAPAPPSTEAWRQLVKRLAANLGAPQVTSVGSDGNEAVHLAAMRDGAPVEVRLQRRAGRVAQAELIVGHAPEGAPPLSLISRGSSKLGPREGAEVATGDKSFDERISVRDGRRLNGSDPILDDEMRPHLARLLDGWLGIWPGQGVRYRSAGASLPRLLAAEDPAQRALLEVIDLLVAVKRR